MIKKTFQTIFNNPKILIGFTILVLIPTLIFLLVYAQAMPSWMAMIDTLSDPTEAEMISFTLLYLASMAGMFVYSIVMVLFVVTPLLSYIGEVCQGIDKPGWYKRGFTKCWWRIPVYAIIAYMTLIPIVIISMFLMVFLNIIGTVIYFVALYAWITFFMIGMNIVVVDNNFGRALGDIFRVGSRYFFKTLGVMVVCSIPSFAVSMFLSFYYVSNIDVQYADDIHYIVEVLQSTMPVTIVLSLLLAVISVFYGAFLTTYNTYNYLKYREMPPRNVVNQMNNSFVPPANQVNNNVNPAPISGAPTHESVENPAKDIPDTNSNNNEIW